MESNDINRLKGGLLYIGSKYGVRHQLKRVQSEIFELNEAIINYENARDDGYVHNFDELKDHVIEEYADVFNMLTQILLLYDIKEDELLKKRLEKLDKHLNRMNNEFEEDF